MLDPKLVTGLFMMAMNLGTRHVVAEITPLQERVLASLVVRRVVLFAIFYIAVRDVLCALCLTCVYVILMSMLFNERSRFFLFGAPLADAK